jgi:hypothetical protein
MSRVSVVVPNYNHARFLRRRMESILKQTFQDFEVIVLDDCSTDESRLILSEYASDSRVRTEFNQANSGTPFKQWNKGVGLARGEYVWIAESDDYADEGLLEKLVARLDAEPTAAFAYCRSWRVGLNDRPDGLVDPFHNREQDHWVADYCANGYAECCKYMVFHNTVPNASGVVFRKAVYERIGGADESLRQCGDWKLWARMALTGKVMYAAEPLNYWRFHSTSVRTLSSRTGTDHVEGVLVRAWILDQVIRPETNSGDARLKASLANACMLLAVDAYPRFPDITRTALQRVRKLGGATLVPRLGTWKVELLKRMIGWKATKRVHAAYASVISKARARDIA